MNISQMAHAVMTYTPDVVGAKRYLQIFEDPGGLLDAFLQLYTEEWVSWQHCACGNMNMSYLKGCFYVTLTLRGTPPWSW